MAEFADAIERVLSRRSFVDYHGPKAAKEMRDKARSRHKLNYENDAPLPQWAIDILKDRDLGGYKCRISILFAHQFDITDTRQSRVFIKESEARNVQQKPTPKWLVDHRKDKAEIAKRILEKYK